MRASKELIAHRLAVYEHEQARCWTGFFLVSVVSIDSRREGKWDGGEGRMGGIDPREILPARSFFSTSSGLRLRTAERERCESRKGQGKRRSI